MEGFIPWSPSKDGDKVEKYVRNKYRENQKGQYELNANV